MGSEDGKESAVRARGDPAAGAGAGGDPAALGDWFDAHGAALVVYARQWLDRPAAEDVVQEGFVRLITEPARQRPGNVCAWLYRAGVGSRRARKWRGRSIRDGTGGAVTVRRRAGRGIDNVGVAGPAATLERLRNPSAGGREDLAKVLAGDGGAVRNACFVRMRRRPRAARFTGPATPAPAAPPARRPCSGTPG
jgi:hypothetical protein